MSAFAQDVTVICPAVVIDGELQTRTDVIPRARVIAWLEGTVVADQLRADPHIGVVSLMDEDAIALWLGPDAFWKLNEDLKALEAD